MEGMNPTLECLYEVQADLALGISLHQSLRKYCLGNSGALNLQLLHWLNAFESGSVNESLSNNWDSEYQKAMIYCFEAGLRGYPILERLEDMIEETERACALEVEEFLGQLPFKALLPVFLFQFPAFLILVLGPILDEWMGSLR